LCKFRGLKFKVEVKVTDDVLMQELRGDEGRAVAHSQPGTIRMWVVSPRSFPFAAGKDFN
jgi:hypothetical protein